MYDDMPERGRYDAWAYTVYVRAIGNLRGR